MVHNAALPGEWPQVSTAVAELFRRGAEILLDLRAGWVDELHTATLRGEHMRPVADDPALAAATRRANLANLLHWAAANVQNPGRRVPVIPSPEMLETARDLVRHGLDENALEAYRSAQNVVWRRWMEICFELTSDPGQLRDLLDVSALSIATFIDDTVTAVSHRMAAERAELTGGAHAERRATVTLLLAGAPISRGRAEARLGYGLTGPHTAAVIWGTSPRTSVPLDPVAEAVMRAADAGHRLTIVANTATLWVWLPVSRAPHVGRMAGSLTDRPDVRIAVGRPGTDIDGFRRSHLDALATQRMLTRLSSPRQVARYQDVQLVALLTADPARADEFIADTLGDLRHADPDTLETVITYLQEGCSTSRTAGRLFTHRNTVVRRLARADELLPRPLGVDVIGVGAALEVLRWRGAR